MIAVRQLDELKFRVLGVVFLQVSEELLVIASVICGIDVKARIMRMLTPTAVSECNTLLSIPMPLRVNA